MMKTNKEWKKYHQLTFTILRQLGFGVKSIMESRILEEVEFFRDHMLKQTENSFNPRELVHHCVTNVIMNIVFGRRQHYNMGITELAYEISRFAENVDVALDIAPTLRFLPFFRNKLRLLVESQNVVHKILELETEKCLEDGADDCFVRRYVESVGPGYDTEQLRFTIRDLIAAGTNTTANTLLWTLIALANNPTVQDRLREEIDAVVPRDALPSMNDQAKLPFVEATILEILRWRTLVPLAVPHMTLCETEVGDYFVPAETLVGLILIICSNQILMLLRCLCSVR